jgi:uncharacterized protein YecE (DUF72 family)
MGKSWVGISGWTFPEWKDRFYPKDLIQRKQLEYASRQVNSIEINGTFYSLQRPTSFQSWYKQTPDDFQFAVKAPQFITHVLRLKNAAEPLSNFFASGLLCLKEKLGPILWQFPPNVMLKDDRFETFLKLLPNDARSAAKCARAHGPKVEGRAFTKAVGSFPVRHAFEFRHPSFLHKDFQAMLKQHNVAFVFAHAGGEKSPYSEEPTADFVYARLHGEGKPYAKGYPDRELDRWAKKMRAWNKSKRDVYLYMSNEAKEYSPADAIKLLRRLGLGSTEKSKKAAA